MSDHSQEMPKTWPELERRFARAIACAGAGPLGQPEAGGTIQLTGKTPREAIYALGGEVIDGPVAMFPAADSLDAAWAEAVTAAQDKGYTLTLEVRPDGWVEATATSADGKHEITDAEHIAGPAVALRALTAKLRGEG